MCSHECRRHVEICVQSCCSQASFWLGFANVAHPTCMFAVHAKGLLNIWWRTYVKYGFTTTCSLCLQQSLIQSVCRSASQATSTSLSQEQLSNTSVATHLQIASHSHTTLDSCFCVWLHNKWQCKKPMCTSTQEGAHSSKEPG